MPYKFETEHLKIPKDKDRRRKLSDSDKLRIKELYGTVSQRKLAKSFGVSRRLIQFIGAPSKLKKMLECRKLRGGSKQYYNKEKQREYMKTHRKYKKSLKLEE